jgi:hypothetical protein
MNVSPQPQDHVVRYQRELSLMSIAIDAVPDFMAKA